MKFKILLLSLITASSLFALEQEEPLYADVINESVNEEIMPMDPPVVTHEAPSRGFSAPLSQYAEFYKKAGDKKGMKNLYVKLAAYNKTLGKRAMTQETTAEFGDE